MVAILRGPRPEEADAVGQALIAAPGCFTPTECLTAIEAGADGFGLGSALYAPGMRTAEVGQRARAFVAAPGSEA